MKAPLHLPLLSVTLKISTASEQLASREDSSLFVRDVRGMRQRFGVSQFGREIQL